MDEEGNSANDREAVLRYLLSCGLVVKFTLGTVIDRKVHLDFLVVHSAPARAVREIVNNFRMVSLRPDNGLMIPLTPLDT